MAFINGYKFDTEQEAIDSREACDVYYGIPKSVDSVTQNWVDYKIAELNDPIFYYFIYDESLVPILGLPSTFEVVTPVILP